MLTDYTPPCAVPAPETDRLVTVTPKGRAVPALYAFLRALALLDAADRAEACELLAEELVPIPA